MRILLTGASGQLATAIRQSQWAQSHDLVAVSRAQFDLAQPHSLAALLDQIKPSCIINTAAYTAVDKAQGDQAMAFTVNRDSPGQLAQWCAARNCRLIHYSTDYVFSGEADQPWRETDNTQPQSVYGASKLDGELAIANTEAAAITLRTSWVYAAHGSNFLLTMLRLAAQKEQLTVVDDQRGAPTTVDFLSTITAGLIALGDADFARQRGVYHCTMQGDVTWRGFAQEIIAQAHALGLLGRNIPVLPTTTAAYAAPAPRPLYSVLNNEKRLTTFAGTLAATEQPWQAGLAYTLSSLQNSRP